MAMTDAEKIFLAREHPIHEAREDQIELNLKVIAGGQPYIDARLSRFPYEPTASWDGNNQTGAQGRKTRAFLTNYAARVARKINQYVFGQPTKRAGLDDEWAKDVTKMQEPIGTFMDQVSLTLTGAKWCWVQIDRAGASVDEQTGTIRQQSVAEREARGDRIFWRIWTPNEVKDWSFDSSGRLRWLITEENLLNNDDPFAKPVMERVRTLWAEGKGERFFLDEKDEISRRVPFTLSSKVVPFVLAGTISSRPHWFDEAEMIQASLLNLESVNHENLFQMVYPQAVYPADLLNGSDAGGTNGTQEGQQPGMTGDVVRRVGLHYPIGESQETKGITRYVMPDASSLKALPDEITRRKREFFEVVGLALATPESKQVASAEAKQWDHMDPEAVLAERARLLQDIEAKCVEMSRKLDSGFKVYEPIYGTEFDLGDVATEFKALLDASTLELPSEGRREILYAGAHLLGKLTRIPSDRMKAIEDEIADMDMTEAGIVQPPAPPPEPPPAQP